MKNAKYPIEGKWSIVLCIAAFLVSQAAFALDYGASAKRIAAGTYSGIDGTTGPENAVDCIGGPAGSDCAIMPDPAYPSYEETYSKCEINLSRAEKKNEEKLQKGIDGLYEKVNGLYEKIDEKSGKLPDHYNETCLEQVNREQLKKSCNLTDADLEEIDRISAEMNSLYEKLSGADDTGTWEGINRLGEELADMYSGCWYDVRYAL